MLNRRTVAGILAIVLSAAMASIAQEKESPAKELYGEWELVEMIFKGKVQDFGGRQGGRMRFEPEKFWLVYPGDDRGYGLPSAQWDFVRPHEIDIQIDGVKRATKALYDLNDGVLRVAWHRHNGERPASYDAINDPNLTLYVLKKLPAKDADVSGRPK